MLRDFAYALITDTAKGFWVMPLRFLLCAGEALFKAYLFVLLKGYECRIFAPYRPDAKVVSIGNLTLGGTGKTQICLMLARLLEAESRKIAVLIRGYGVDESRMLEEELPGVPVLIGRDRIKNSKRAFYEFGADTIVLDDGFQHYKLDRDLDIVLIDASNPFGNHRLIPRGILREPISQLRRADIVIITKVDFGGGNLPRIYREIGKFVSRKKILEALYRPVSFSSLLKPGEKLGLDAISGKKICVLSSIANPGYFKHKLNGLGPKIELEFTYPDHYDYKESDLRRVIDDCVFFKVDLIVTTKKDAVKIRKLGISCADVPILVFDVELDIIKNKESLTDGLYRLYSR
ncbi:MAG: tetraacyldisaccharide 4'-kinase [Candidatus Omnitrophota bacterium]